MSNGADKSLVQSRILWSSMGSAFLSTLCATLTAPDDVPAVVLKILSALAATASVAAAFWRAQDHSAAKKQAESTREVQATK